MICLLPWNNLLVPAESGMCVAIQVGYKSDLVLCVGDINQRRLAALFIANIWDESGWNTLLKRSLYFVC